MISERTRSLDKLLDTAIGSFDIPDELYELAVRRYEDVGGWLSECSERRGSTGEVYTQGSFRLGTVVRPITEHDEYDVDLVYRRDVKKGSLSQAKLKQDAGSDLTGYVQNRPEGQPDLEEGKRCWTLLYKHDPFHMDVLPAIPDPDDWGEGILLTDKNLKYWQRSNPVDYSEWFKSRMIDEFVRLREATMVLMDAVEVEDVPEWKVKTTLQRTIQALKRHRDIYFQRREKDKPASIIITTLAAKSYVGGGTLHDVATTVVQRMPEFVEQRADGFWVPNPVQQSENFADRWREYPKLANAFFEWMDKARADFDRFSVKSGLDHRLNVINEALGRRAADSAGAAYGSEFSAASASGQLGIASASGLLSTSSRRPAPRHTFHGDNILGRGH